MELKNYYVDLATGEVTEDRETAMNWYRIEDHSIEVYRNGHKFVTMWGGLFD